MRKKVAPSQFLIPNSTFLIAIDPPQPPTAPAPALRPTPPTPPRIDRSPFAKDKASDDTPEAQARDAVANGSGALTKRTVDKGDTQPDPPNQTVTVIPPDAPIIPDSQSDYDRGKDVLREFKDLDARQADSTPYSSAEQSRPVITKFNHQEGHGGAFWIFTIIFVAVASFVIVKKFLLTDKPALTKSQLFEDSSSRLQATADKVKPVKTTKPVTTSKPARTIDTSNKKATTDKIEPVKPPPPRSPKKDDDKGKHFEVRV